MNIISSIVRSDPTIAGVRLTFLVSPQARKLRLRLDPRTRTLRLTIPDFMSRRRAIAWAAEQSDWVEAQLARVAPIIPFEPDSVFPFRGEDCRIRWDTHGPLRPLFSDGQLHLGGNHEMLDLRVGRWLRREALATLTIESRDLAGRIGARLTRIGIGDPVSRWGSCSSAGSIRYSWRLILAPDFVRRATVAHEVAHLVHLDHGRAFHRLVEILFGADPAPARTWLRRNGAALHRVGRTD